MNRSAAVTAILSVAVIALSACGGEDNGDGPSASDREKLQEAALKHAKCLRDHGLDVPDPKFDGGRVTMEMRADQNTDPAKVERAQKECEHILEDAPRPEISPEQEAKARDQALAHAKCMREHGIDFPDPEIDGGRIRQRVGGDINPEDPKFQQASEECGEGMIVGGGPDENEAP
jgi:hypothetical protein